MKKVLLIFTLLGILASSHGAGGGAGGHSSGKSSSQGEFDDSWSLHVSYGGDRFISEGSPFHITCTLTLFDQLKWTLNGRPIKFEDNGYTVAEIPAPQGFIGSRLSLAKSGKEHAGDYKCTTFSSLSHSIYILSADESIGIDCKIKSRGKPNDPDDEKCSRPRIVKWYAGSTESTKLIREGVPLPLECKISVDKSDDDKVEVELELKWFKDDVPVEDDDRYKIFKENSSLLILSATQEDVGVYRCQTDKFKPAKFFNISVAFLTYRNMAKSTTVLEGDKLYLTCDVDGNPKPIITWLKDGDNVEDSVNSSRFRLNENEKKTENATFLIEEAVYQDRAVYTCVIATGDIQYNTTTFVRIKDMYAALWPFLGICAEVFILCLIIFVYEKRRAKIEFEESDTDQPTDQKNTSDHNKDSVRHRK